MTFLAALVLVLGALVGPAAAGGATTDPAVGPVAPSSSDRAGTGGVVRERLVWSEDFEGPAGSAPSPATWLAETGNAEAGGWGNAELQYYTGSPENVALDGRGHLLLTAREVGPDDARPCWDGLPCLYTSARLTTRDRMAVRYGRVGVRLRVPAGQGLWPAFWMMGANGETWPANGEIDVMEHVGSLPQDVVGTIHAPGYSGADGLGGQTALPEPLAAGFHRFAVAKRPGDLRWYVDGREYLRLDRDDVPAGSSWIFDQPFYLMLNLAVGGTWPGSPDTTTTFPATLEVDWVRVHELPGLPVD